MKAVLFIACICIASAAAVPTDIAMSFVRILGITEAEARFCIDKTNAVRADFKALEDQITEASEELLLQQQNTRRAICAITCAAQAQGTMIGAKMNPPKIHDFMEKSFGMPPDIRTKVHEFIDICSLEVTDVTNECAAGLKFITCLIEKNEASRN